ncbi:MAG TPA: DEAD/DEAH box helicase [Thermoanaerobaculia bacterium]|nr:DEAD/DEAH box helicase [Thermoanaerobaculia bacterium]
MPFQTLGLGPKLVKALEQAGYTEPTPIQAKSIPEILKGRDVIGIAQTGTGKTAAFVLPMLEMMSTSGVANHQDRLRALVIAPTRELVVQIEQNVRKYGAHLNLKYATIFGGVGEGPQIQAVRRGVDLVVATPGRLLDLMNQGHVKFNHLQILVLDEADRMLDMGFLPDIRRIVKTLPTKRQTLLFSATLSPEIEKTSAEFLTRPEVIQAGKRATPAETVTQFVYKVSKDGRLSLLMHLLQDSTLDSVLVFSRTKHGADKIARKLAQSGISTATLHSNRSQNQRLQALKEFKSGAVRVLVATDIAARGIDVVGISHVINFDFPPNPEDYVHRIGRTGRAHAIGDAISFVTGEDEGALRQLEKFIGRGIPRKVAEGVKYEAPAPSVPREQPRRPARVPSPFGARNDRRPQSSRPANRGEQMRRDSIAARGQGRGAGRPGTSRRTRP